MELIGLSFTAASGIASGNTGRSAGNSVFTLNGALSDDNLQAGPASVNPNLNTDADLQDGSTAEPKAEEIMAFLPFANTAPPPVAAPLPLALNRLGMPENTPLPARVDLMAAITQQMDSALEPETQPADADGNITVSSENNLTDASVENAVVVPGTKSPKLPAANISETNTETAWQTSMRSALPAPSDAKNFSGKQQIVTDQMGISKTLEASHLYPDNHSGTEENSHKDGSAKASANISGLAPKDEAASSQHGFNIPAINSTIAESSTVNSVPATLTTAQSSAPNASSAAPFAQSGAPVVLDQNFAERIGQEIAMMTKTDRGISLQVAPANLGLINIEIMADPAGDTIRLTSENAEVRQMILQTQARIEQDMRQAGQKILGFEVAGGSVGDDVSDSNAFGGAQQNMADKNQERTEQQAQAHEFYSSVRSGDSAEEQPASANTNDQVRYA